MDGNKEIDAVATHVDDDKDLQGAQPKEEEIAFLDEGQVAELVVVIGSELSESVHLRQISRKEVGPTIVIPKVPDRFRKDEKDAYEPSIVSIGPYHMHKPRLEAMQKHKWRFLRKILDRNPNVQLKDYVLAITQLAEQARRCYDLESIHLKREEREAFVQMLVLDGCFFVELFLPVMDHTKEKEDFFSVAWNISQAFSDLLILENQIPFFILQCIYELATPPSPTTHAPSFTQIVINSCNSMSPYIPKHMQPPPATEIHHFLHLYHMHTIWPRKLGLEYYSSSWSAITFRKLKSIVWPLLHSFGCLKKKFSHTPRLRNRVRSMPSATELIEAGVKLEVNLSAKSIVDVGFSRDGVIEIPQLFIHHLTNSHFRNLVAFEQLVPNSGLHFTAYVKFLNYLVNTPKDVALLQRNGIIKHPSVKKEEVVHLFSSVARETTDPLANYLQDLYEEVERCCMKRRQKWRATRHKWWATLVHDYFSSPWSVMSLTAAIILLLLTFLQTYCSLYSYLHPSP